MSDDVARALGAHDPEPVKIAGKDCPIRPLGAKELTEIERECLRVYKRQVLETYTLGSDLLPAGMGDQLLREKLSEISLWDSSSLPPKLIIDPLKLVVNDDILKWIKEKLEFDPVERFGGLSAKLFERSVKQTIAAAIGTGMMDEGEYTKLAGSPPTKQKVGYVNWWISSTYEGMMTLVWYCFKDSGVTKDQVLDELGKSPQMMIDVSRRIEQITAAASGNG